METSTKRNILIWSVIVLVLLNISSLGTIWYHRYQFKHRVERPEPMRTRKGNMKDPGNPERRMLGFLLKDMDMTKDQRSEFEGIWMKYADKRDGFESQLMNNRIQMAEILKSADLDTTAYFSLSEAQVALMSNLERLMLEMNLEFRESMNEEQLSQFLHRLEQMNQRFKGRSNRRMRK